MLQLDIRAAFYVAPSDYLKGKPSRALGAYASRPLRAGELFRIPVTHWGQYVEAEAEGEFHAEVTEYERRGLHYHRFEAPSCDHDPVAIHGRGSAPWEGTRRAAKDLFGRVLTPAHAAFIHPESSWGYMLNDAGFSARERMSARVYAGRASELNHASFLNGIGPDGLADCLFLRMDKDVAVGQEVFVTYGWGFWSQCDLSEGEGEEAEVAGMDTSASGE